MIVCECGGGWLTGLLFDPHYVDFTFHIDYVARRLSASYLNIETNKKQKYSASQTEESSGTKCANMLRLLSI